MAATTPTQNLTNDFTMLEGVSELQETWERQISEDRTRSKYFGNTALGDKPKLLSGDFSREGKIQ